MKAIASNGVEIKTGDEVLVRDSTNSKWLYCLFSHTNKNEERKYATSFTTCKYCIPYKGNESLVGTTKNFNEPFEFKFGAKVKAQLRGETITGILIGCRNKEKWYDTYRVAINECNDDNNDYIGETYWVSEIKYLN